MKTRVFWTITIFTAVVFGPMPELLGEENIRIEDESFTRQSLQTGETISNPEVILTIESLGAILIVLFIVIYAIKKRRKTDL